MGVLALSPYCIQSVYQFVGRDYGIKVVKYDVRAVTFAIALLDFTENYHTSGRFLRRRVVMDWLMVKCLINTITLL